MRGVPAKLYKYRGVNDYTQAIFKRNELYFAAPSQFNDPFDSAFQVIVEGPANQKVFEALAFELVKKKLPEFSMKEKLDAAQQIGAALIQTKAEEARLISIEKLAKDTNDKVRILSLSEKNDDILMWSHYADSHKGICLEFDTSPASFLNDAQPVTYDDTFPALNLLDIVVDEDLRKTAPWLLTKARQWEYEREWRVLDFDGGSGVKSFPPTCLTGVILGCRITDEDRERVLSWILARGGGIAVSQASEVPGQFRISAEPFPMSKKA